MSRLPIADAVNAWQRERKRWPALAALLPGSVMRRWYKDEMHDVTVMGGYYLYRGHRHPTLYSVMARIVGEYRLARTDGKRPYRMVCAYTTKRFFGDAVMNTQVRWEEAR